MPRATGGRLAVLVVFLLAVGACSRGGGDDATTSTTGRGTTTEATATTDGTTTTGGSVCATPPAPSGPDVAVASGDVDGDGDADRIYSASPQDAAPAWTLVVALAAGGGATLSVPAGPNGAGDVLGGADIDGDSTDEVWIRTGFGASATIVGLVRFVDCQLVRATFANGDPVELAVGGSVGTGSGLVCEAHVEPTADLTTYTATNVSGDQYEVTAVEFALDAGVLVQKGTTTSSATAGDDAFARATSFDCDGVVL